MQTIGLSSYIVRVRKKREINVFQPLNRFDETTDLLKFIVQTLRSKQNQSLEIGDKRRAQVNNDIKVDARSFDGTLDVGEFGVSSMLRGKDGANSFRRTPDHAEMIPLFYRFWLPDNQSFGVLVLQSFGQYGCKMAIDAVLGDAFKERFDDYVLEIREVVSREMVEHYFSKGAVKEFTFLQHGVPKDWADGYGGEQLSEGQASLEVRVKARAGKSLPMPNKLASYFKREGLPEARLFELNKFECEAFKVKLEVDGKTRTVRHTELFTMASRVDVTDEVETHKSGHPKIDSLRPLAIALIQGLAKESNIKR